MYLLSFALPSVFYRPRLWPRTLRSSQSIQRAHEFRISNYGTHFAGISASTPGSGVWVDVNAVPPQQAETWTFTFCKIDYMITWEDGATQEFHQNTCTSPNLVLTH
jgi:hypothetical protein